MKAEQLSVFLENRAGRLADVTHALAEAGVSIRALSLADTSDFGILRLLVKEHDKAQAILKEKGFTVGSTSVVAVRVDDAPGGLDAVLQLVSKHGINVEYMYSLIRQARSEAIMIFRFDKIDLALSVLAEHHFNLVDPEQIYA
ncbi:MAG: ACT domain-containing protein [Desulfovibrio sp.]|nr:ACT domain-containing protein [Desulfovibrio sp.]